MSEPTWDHAEIAQDSFKFQGSGVSHTDAEFCRRPAQFLLLMDHLSASPMPNHYHCTMQQNLIVIYNNNQQQEKLSYKYWRSSFIRSREFLVTPINLLGSKTVVSLAAHLPQRLWSHFWEIKRFVPLFTCTKLLAPQEENYAGAGLCGRTWKHIPLN